MHALGFEVLALVICAPLFDRAQRRIGFKRTVGARVVHSLLFEVGLIVAVVPLAMATYARPTPVGSASPAGWPPSWRAA